MTPFNIRAILQKRKTSWEMVIDIWNFIRGLKGVTLCTLDPNRSQTFAIEDVMDDRISLRTAGGNRLIISREKILNCWSLLIRKQKVNMNLDMHVGLGLGRSASYVAAILARVHGIIVHTKPILLEYRSTQ